MLEQKYIYDLVEKFLDGRTTNAEERELYDLFKRDDIPLDLIQLRPMFRWYEEGMPEPKTEAKTDPETDPETERKTEAKPSHRTLAIGWAAVGTIAASILLIGLVWQSHRPTFETIYDGSYIVEGGVMCDDMEYIEDDIIDLLERADAIESRADELLAWAEI